MVGALPDECGLLADQVVQLGRYLWTTGAIIGPDRVSGKSRWGYGSNETVGLGLVTEIGGELAQSIVALLHLDHRYAAAALLRQMIEVDYLAWWHANEPGEAAAWLRASPEELQQMFRPAAIRRLSDGWFSRDDYRAHCWFTFGNPSSMQPTRSACGMHRPEIRKKSRRVCLDWSMSRIEGHLEGYLSVAVRIGPK